MPVYLFTAHAYRSWGEDHPRGYVQRGKGLQESNERLAHWRAANARHEPARFDGQLQGIIMEAVESVAAERGVRLHALAVTLTHVHILVSFRSPACTCGASKFCRKACEGRKFVETFGIRAKRKMGQMIAKTMETKDRPWLSRGWDLTPVRDREHFDFLVAKYLPKHEREEGIARTY
ncbi:MAG: hypothetical protein ABSC42_04525 [Tepidisphaeraceae bacterium]|jgi:hypothetical protein